MNPRINIIGLNHYSLSKDGRVFLGDREVIGGWSDDVTYTFALTPKRNTYPNPFDIRELYEKVYGCPVPTSVIKRLKTPKDHAYLRVSLHGNGERLEMSMDYTKQFLGASETKIEQSINNGTLIGGFKLRRV